MSTISLQEFNKDNIEDVLRIQAACYLNTPLEQAEVFTSRARIFPSGALVALSCSNVAGYVFCHPIRMSEPPALNDTEYTLDGADSFYVHDLAIDPAYRGNKIASRLVEEVFSIALQCAFDTICLTAVEGSFSFWEKYGFREQELLPGTIKSYGAQAIPLSCSLRSYTDR